MVQLRKIGNSQGLTIPKEALSKAGFSDNQTVSLKVSSGQITILKAEDNHDKAMKAHELCKGRYDKALSELAK